MSGMSRVPECLIKDRRPYQNNKSDILEVIAPKSKAAINYTEVVVKSLVIDTRQGIDTFSINLWKSATSSPPELTEIETWQTTHFDDN